MTPAEAGMPQFNPDLFVLVVWDEDGLGSYVGCQCCDKVVRFRTVLFDHDEAVRFIQTRPMRWWPRSEYALQDDESDR